MKAFITGTAGFIGFHLARRLLEQGHEVVGFDGFTNYYDPALKRSRVEILKQYPRFQQIEAMLEDASALDAAIRAATAETVYHLAAQAGVRYSLDHPQSYIKSNVVGTANLLEALRRTPPKHFIFASTSSVYGGNTKMPFAELDRADSPASLYAATKKSCEAMIHSYSHLFSIPSTCVRFFTVYGPWGRPDMALFKFTNAILSGKPIDVYGHGQMRRDFTYVDDLVDAMLRLGEALPVRGAPVSGDSLSAIAPFRTVNIAGGRPTELMDFIKAIETVIDQKAELNLMEMQAGDVVATESDTTLLRNLIGSVPETSLKTGVACFIEWYRARYLTGTA
ncbi:NAD-dependent epimerase/dehydratase family protein [Devosia aurantiaca]|uniref:NAD-dependent epimerase/dehydratase family protein n=1 Tax=Devosia aurantiaca TaxID=2714858 RepID=A0A6M1SPQ7_9HYPH|nr:NAD-dependent epimerase/dehydratase family protein [Devosia aurantiaca]NGP18546.1 NAD-dependent epimerase/dehydratase family protein [Devosia aurantiaca]